MQLKPVARARLDKLEKEILACPKNLLNAIPADSTAKWKTAHIRTIKLRRGYSLPSEAASDPSFLTELRRTLRAWSVGTRAVRLVESADFEHQIKRAACALDCLSSLRVEDGRYDADGVTATLWNVIASLEITTDRTLEIVEELASIANIAEVIKSDWDEVIVRFKKPRLVPATKVIHHLLPDLMPPMDRAYTGKFFEKSSYWFHRDREERTFFAMFPAFVRLARCLAPQLEPFISPDSFNTSIPKALDNAIIGFMTEDGDDPR